MQLAFSWLCVSALGLCGMGFSAPSVPREEGSMHPDEASTDLTLATVSQTYQYSSQNMKLTENQIHIRLD